MLPVILFECGADLFLLVSVHAVSYPSPFPPRNETCSNRHRDFSRTCIGSIKKVRCVACYSEDGAWIRSSFIDWLVLVCPSCAGDDPRRQSPESWKGWRPRWRYTKHTTIQLISLIWLICKGRRMYQLELIIVPTAVARDCRNTHFCLDFRDSRVTDYYGLQTTLRTVRKESKDFGIK